MTLFDMLQCLDAEDSEKLARLLNSVYNTEIGDDIVAGSTLANMVYAMSLQPPNGKGEFFMDADYTLKHQLDTEVTGDIDVWEFFGGNVLNDKPVLSEITDDYGHIIVGSIYSLISSTKKGVVNRVRYSCDCCHPSVSMASILSGFDLNCCRVAFQREHGFHIEPTFKYFCNNHCIDFRTIRTPFHSYIRAVDKAKKLGCDFYEDYYAYHIKALQAIYRLHCTESSDLGMGFVRRNKNVQWCTKHGEIESIPDSKLIYVDLDENKHWIRADEDSGLYTILFNKNPEDIIGEYQPLMQDGGLFIHHYVNRLVENYRSENKANEEEKVVFYNTMNWEDDIPF
ncbi:MAG: hypothetical protein GY861_21075 [bacterium]|nr:hypothetical protein [bacterium]